MLVCVSCGRALVSDGIEWTCPAKNDEYAHSDKNPPTTVKDKRLTLNKVSTVHG